MEEDLPLDETLSGGNDQPQIEAPVSQLPTTRDGGLDVTALIQAMRTGSQGRAMPSYSTDIANVGGRVAKILERNLRDMEQDKGYGRIGAALSQDIASGGRVPYAIGMEQLRGREVGQAVNIANATSGLARRLGGEGDMRQMATLLQKRTEQAAREGNQKAGRINEMVRAASNGFDDPPMAQASIYAFMAKKQKENPNLDVNELPQLMSEAIMDARRNGLGRKRTKYSGGGGGGGGASVPNLPMSGGEVDYDKILPGKDQNARLWNMSTPEERKGLREAWLAKAKRVPGQSGGDAPEITYGEDGTVTFRPGVGSKTLDPKNDDAFEKSAISAWSTVRVMDKIRADLDKSGGNIVGWLGGAGALLNDLKSQVSTLLSGLPDDAASRAVKSGFGDVSRWDSALPTFIKEGPNAAVNKARFITLAYALAGSREPGGRLTEQDVRRAMDTLGASGGDPVTIKKVLADTEAEMVQNMRDRQAFSRKFSGMEPFDPRKRFSGQASAGSGGDDLKGMSTEDLLKALNK